MRLLVVGHGPDSCERNERLFNGASVQITCKRHLIPISHEHVLSLIRADYRTHLPAFSHSSSMHLTRHPHVFNITGNINYYSPLPWRSRLSTLNTFTVTPKHTNASQPPPGTASPRLSATFPENPGYLWTSDPCQPTYHRARTPRFAAFASPQIRIFAVQSLSPFPLKEKNSIAEISMGVGLITDLLDK